MYSFLFWVHGWVYRLQQHEQNAWHNRQLHCNMIVGYSFCLTLKHTQIQTHRVSLVHARIALHTRTFKDSLKRIGYSPLIEASCVCVCVCVCVFDTLLKQPAVIWKQLVVDGSSVLDISDCAYYRYFDLEEFCKSSRPPNPEWIFENDIYICIHDAHQTFQQKHKP